MRIWEVLLVCLCFNICFCEETHNHTKDETEEDGLTRWKRAKIQPKENKSLLKPDAIKISLNENPLLPKLRHGLSKKVEPITNLKRVIKKANVLPIFPKINQNLRLPAAHITLPTSKALNIQKSLEVPVLKEHNDEEKVGFFVDKGDAEEIMVEKEHEKHPTVTASIEPPTIEPKNEINTSTTPLHDPLHEHEPETYKKEEHSASEVNTEVHNASCIEKLTHHDVKLPVDKLANENNTHGEELLKDIIKQLPHIIQSLLADKKTVSPVFIIHNSNGDSTSILTPHNFSRNGDVLKLLLKPIIGNERTEGDVDDLPEICWRINIQNESINSIKILHKNYTEITEKAHGCEKTYIPKHVDQCDHTVHENIAENAAVNAHENKHHVLSPLDNTSHEAVRYNSSHDSHNHHLGENAHPTHLHDSIPNFTHHYHYVPDHTYTKPPYVNPTSENIKTYAFKADDNGQLKSGSFIDDDGKNTTWKTWSNTEVVIKTGNNKHTDNELEATKVQPTPSYANQPNLAEYKDLHHNVPLYRHPDRHPGFNNIYRYNNISPPSYNIQNLPSPSYITYYPEQNKAYPSNNYEDSNIMESNYHSHIIES